MRYASLGTVNIEDPQANFAWANIFELPSVATNTGKTWSDNLRAKGATNARQIRRDLQSNCLETELMTLQRHPAKYQHHLRNNQKCGRI
jgi:hypothetical protein